MACGHEWFTHFGALVRKNAIVSVRSWRSTAQQVLAPVAISLLLLGLQALADRITASSDPDPLPLSLSRVPRCSPQPCATILYGPKGVLWVDAVMKRVADGSGLAWGSDVRAMYNASEERDISADQKALCDYVSEHQNKTQSAVLFTSAYFPVYDPTSPLPPDDTGYVLFFNYTWAKWHRYHSPSLHTMRAIDEALLQLKSGDDAARLNASVSAFPRAPLRTTGLDVVASNGAVYFYVAPMIIFFSLLSDIVGEKETRLRLGARMMGTSQSAYWASWLLHGVSFSVISTLMLVASGAACMYDVFVNTMWLVQPALFGLFGISMVAMACMLSTLVKRAATAQTVGYAVILVGFVFQSILCAGYGVVIILLYNPGRHTWVRMVRVLLQLYPPFNLAKAYTDIASLSSSTLSVSKGGMSKGPGFFWSDLWKAHTPAGLGTVAGFSDYISPAPGWALMWMLVDTAVFLLLAWYFDNAIPGDHGSHRPPLFFLSAEYWGFRRAHIAEQYVAERPDPESEASEYDEDVAAERKLAAESVPGDDVAVSVVNITKVYDGAFAKCKKSGGGVLAVDDVSFTVRPGEVLCLLGHNGAGKTTLLSMLTGLFLPTSGRCTMFDLDLVGDMDELRKTMGVCPQHNVLWEDLTADEHLRFFARIKGVPSRDLDAEVEDRLKQVGLEKVGNNRVSTFSGGMKRRLSVAISAIGNPKILFLDEPSTGMDPINRAKMWHLILEMKQGRSIILTTHSMEEAEVLGDRIAVMAKGKVRCVGTALHLKSLYGSGYHVTAVSHGAGHADAVVSRVQNSVPEAVLKESDAGSLSFTIPREARAHVPGLLRSLQTAATEDLIQEWGISHSSLEEVFMNVTRKYDPPVIEEDEKQNSSSPPIEGKEDAKLYAKAEEDRGRNSRPFAALFRKTATLQLRQKGANACQIFAPLLILVIMLIIKLALKSILGDAASSDVFVPSVPLPLNVPLDSIPLISRKRVLDLSAVPASSLWEFARLEEPHRDLLKDRHAVGKLGETWWNASLATCYKSFVFDGDAATANTLMSEYGTYFDCNMTGNSTATRVPVVQRQGNANKYIYTTLLRLNDADMNEVVKPPLLYALPDASVRFHTLDPTSLSASFTVAVNDNALMYYHRANNFTLLDLHSNATQDIDSHFRMPITQARLAVLSFVDDAFATMALNRTAATGLNLLNIKLAASLPNWEHADALIVIDGVGSFLYPLALTLQLPLFAYILVMEREDGMRNLMRAHGLRNVHYLFVCYVFFFMLFAVSVAFFWMTGAFILRLRLFSQTNPLTLVLFLFGWGNSLVSGGLLLAGLVGSRRGATVVGYAVALIGTVVSLVVAIALYGQFDFSVTERMPIVLNLWPQFALVRGINLMNGRCALDLACYEAPWNLNPNDELVGVVGMLFVDAVWLLIAAIYADIARAKGDALWAVRPLVRFVRSSWRAWCNRRGGYEELPINVESDEMPPYSSLNMQDPDVAEEERRVNTGKYSDQPLVVENLVKEYPDARGTVAVAGVSFGVSHGECFGLLGENGAGKTTTVSMLSGALHPTKGTASVAGNDIVMDAGGARLAVGVCPQFSVLWDDLTPEEHLLFFARLKGVPSSEEDAHVRSSLRDFGLEKFAARPACALSGGMRRRLSVAISLIGGSAIAFLDEPTTGLDPNSRRQLWRVVRRARTGRAIVLTTHSMEEAETLCTRIAIMARGTIRCIGSAVHLKNRHAGGYRLLASFAASDAGRVTQAVRGVFPDAEEIPGFGFSGVKEWRVKVTADQVPTAFEEMDRVAQTAGIVDWSFAQLGLGEVFQQIVRETNGLK
eukprot:m51a1_g3825 hypothetical protein (1807) ;mRNA; r:294618-300690